MKYFILVWAGLSRKRSRTILNLLSIASAFLLFTTLEGVSASISRLLAAASETRLYVQSRVNFAEGLPVSYATQIEAVPGVRRAAYLDMLFTHYQNPKNPVLVSAVDIDRYLDVSPDIILSPEQRAAMARTRNGALVGRDLAKQWNWKIGDRVPLVVSGATRRGSGQHLEFDVVGIYDDKSGARDFLIHYDFVNEGRVAHKGLASMYFVSIDQAQQSAKIAELIDRGFANSSHQTETLSEKDFMRSQLSRIGDVDFLVWTVVSGVLFTILLLTAIVTMQSLRERLPEFALLRACGYRRIQIAGILFTEELVLCGAAALIGIGIAAVIFPRLFAGLGLPAFAFPMSVVAGALTIGVVLAVASAVVPVINAWTMQIAPQLSGAKAR
jgi:putative ABC transport system permease protein